MNNNDNKLNNFDEIEEERDDSSIENNELDDESSSSFEISENDELEEDEPSHGLDSNEINTNQNEDFWTDENEFANPINPSISSENTSDLPESRNETSSDIDIDLNQEGLPINSSEFSISITDINGKEFNGPFELFYSLIKERKMDILNINLAEVIQLYVNYINSNLFRLKIDDLTEYLLMATYLLEQKSKRILPSMETEEIISKDIERDKYIQRLLIYKQYQAIVPKLIEKMERRSRMFERQITDSQNKENLISSFQQDDYVPSMNLDVILKAMQKVYLKLVTTKKPKSTKSNIKLIDVSEISIDDVEKEIRVFLEPFPHLFRISFMDYFKNIPDEKFTKRYFVVAFVAILVLVRNGYIQLEQNNSDEEIFIVKIDKEVENNEY